MRNIDYWARSRNKKKLGVLYTKNMRTRTINEIHNLRNNKKPVKEQIHSFILYMILEQ